MRRLNTSLCLAVNLSLCSDWPVITLRRSDRDCLCFSAFRQLCLDLVPRKEFSMVDPEEISVTELYRLVGYHGDHVLSSLEVYRPKTISLHLQFSHLIPFRET